MKTLAISLLFVLSISVFSQDSACPREGEGNENNAEVYKLIQDLWTKIDTKKQTLDLEEANLISLLKSRPSENQLINKYKEVDALKDNLINLYNQKDEIEKKRLELNMDDATFICLYNEVDSTFYTKMIIDFIGTEKTLPALRCEVNREDENEVNAFNQFTELRDTIAVVKKEIKIKEDELLVHLKNPKENSEELKTVRQKIKEKREELNNQLKKNESFIGYFTVLGVDKNKLDCYSGITDKAEETIESLTLIGGELFKSKELFNDERRNKVLEKLITENSENKLGKFIIPSKEEAIEIYKFRRTDDWIDSNENRIKVKHKKRKKKFYLLNNITRNEDKREIGLHAEHKYEYCGKQAKLKFVKFNIYEGSIEDIKATVIINGKDVVFSNKLPIALYFFHKNSQKYYLGIENKDTKDIYTSKDVINNCQWIRLTDVLKYKYEEGENYVPSDFKLTLPIEDEQNITQNEYHKTSYEIIEDTRLQNILDLRTYSDMLGLFGEEENGLVSLEASAEFYIAPGRVFRNTHHYFLKKINPYVRFSRIDEDQRNITLSRIDTVSIDGNSKFVRKINTPLDLIQRSYLNFGLNLELTSFKFGKSSPVELRFWAGANYYVSDIQTGTDLDDTENYKTPGFNLTFNPHIRRYNNFGFDYRLRFEWISTRLQNDIIYETETTTTNDEGMEEMSTEEIVVKDPDNFFTMFNEFEVDYFPNQKKNNRFFVRLGIMQDLSEDFDSEFFNFQFGYSFALGLNSIKAK